MSGALEAPGALRRFRPYPHRRDSGIDWLGEAPTHWEPRRAKFLFRRVQRAVRQGDEIVTAFRDGTVTLRANRRSDGFTLADKEIGYQGIRVGDLVVHAMDGFAGAIGVSDSDGKSTPVYAAMVPLSGMSIDSRFYAYLIRHLALCGYVTSLARGIRERSTEFRYKEVKELWLPTLPIDEQRAIADFLDRETGKIDALVAKKERLIELLQEKSTALITHAVTRGLDPTVPMKPSGIEWLGDIPAHWKGSKMRRHCRSIRDGTHNPPPREVGAYRLLSVRNIVEGEFVLRPDDRRMGEQAFVGLQRSYTVEPGDIVLAIVGATTGKSAVVGRMERVTVQRSLAILRPRDTEVLSEFLNYWIRSNVVQKLIMSTYDKYAAQPGIYLDDVSQLPVLVPPLAEQHEMVDALDESMELLAKLAAGVRVGVQRLAELRAALISAAITGKIDVREEKAT